MSIQNLDLPMGEIKKLCGSLYVARSAKRWQIIEFAVFGSVLRDDFKLLQSDEVIYGA